MVMALLFGYVLATFGQRLSRRQRFPDDKPRLHLVGQGGSEMKKGPT